MRYRELLEMVVVIHVPPACFVQVLGFSAQYAGEEDWALRLAIERSDAIKCPSVAYQLAGLKKIQLELTRPEAISKYV